MNPLLVAYLAAQAQLQSIYATAVAGDGQQRDSRQRAAWLAALLAAALRVIDRLDEAARTYAANDVADLFAQGAISIDPEWRWSDAEIDIAHGLAADSFADLAAANDDIRAAARRLFRDLQARSVDAETRAGQIMAAELASRSGIDRVLYRNGARFPLASYAEMAVRTKLAVAFTAGALNAAAGLGALYIEVIDGPECGWTYHRDPDLADGSIRSIDDFAANPIAHPNCVRRPGVPRFDVNNDREARNASPTPSAPTEAPVDVPVEAAGAGVGAAAASGVATATATRRSQRTTAMSERRAARQYARLRRTQR